MHKRLAILLLILAAFLYLWNLGRAPVYLGGDEAHFGVEAQSIAATGHDLSGRVLPLFVNLTDPAGTGDTSVRWYQPTLFYLTAAVLEFAPLTESSVRLPAALIGLLDLVLIFAVAQRMFGRGPLPLVAMAMLMLAPAHVIFSRQATDYICTLPYVLGWLWCVSASLESEQIWLSLAAGAILGVGFYSYITSWLLMPLLLLATWATQYQSQRHVVRRCVAAGIGFAVPLVPFVIWIWLHPEMLTETLGRYGLPGGGHATVFEHVRAFLRPSTLQNVISIYADFFNPVVLFLTGGASMTTSTHRAGVFLLPLAVFIPLGLYELLARRRSIALSPALLAGFFVAPIPAALIGERYMIQRDLLVLPFGALIAAFGAARMLRSSRTLAPAVAIGLLALMPLQFAYFYRDFQTHYQHRSAFYFDSVDFRDATDYLLAQDAAHALPAIYLSDQLDDGAARWRFYLTVHHREDLLPRTQYIDVEAVELNDAPAGSALMLYADGARVARLVGTGRWKKETTIVDMDGRDAAAILRRTP